MQDTIEEFDSCVRPAKVALASFLWQRRWSSSPEYSRL